MLSRVWRGVVRKRCVPSYKELYKVELPGGPQLSGGQEPRGKAARDPSEELAQGAVDQRAHRRS